MEWWEWMISTVCGMLFGLALYWADVAVGWCIVGGGFLAGLQFATEGLRRRTYSAEIETLQSENQRLEKMVEVNFQGVMSAPMRIRLDAWRNWARDYASDSPSRALSGAEQDAHWMRQIDERLELMDVVSAPTMQEPPTEDLAWEDVTRPTRSTIEQPCIQDVMSRLRESLYEEPLDEPEDIQQLRQIAARLYTGEGQDSGERPAMPREVVAVAWSQDAGRESVVVWNRTTGAVFHHGRNAVFYHQVETMVIPPFPMSLNDAAEWRYVGCGADPDWVALWHPCGNVAIMKNGELKQTWAMERIDVC